MTDTEQKETIEPNPGPPPKKETRTNKLIELAKQKCSLFKDERGVFYAALKNGHGLEISPINSKSFDVILSGLYIDQYGEIFGNETLSVAKRFISHYAKRTAIDLKNRFYADSTDSIFLNLGGAGSIAHVTSNNINILQDPPVMFRQFPHQKEIDISSKSVELQQMKKYLNIKKEEDLILVLVWMILAPFSNISRPILCFHGPQGSAKTTAAKLIRALIDPSTDPVTSPKNDTSEWALTFYQHAIPIFDNLTKLQNWQADMLCKAVTGDGLSKRSLYTDDEMVSLSYKRAIIMSGINIPSVQPDLLDRCLLIELARPKPTERKDEKGLWEQFNHERPSLVRGLLQAISKTLRYKKKEIDIPLMRMADFSLLGCAAAKALGYSEKQFLAALEENLNRQHQEVIESQPLARAIIRLADKEGTWVGTASDLADALKKLVGEDKGEDDFSPVLWQPHALGRKVRELQATLMDYGISILFIREGRGRVRTIKIEGTPKTSRKNIVRAVRTSKSEKNKGNLRTATDSTGSDS